MTVILLCGLAGAGKSIIAEELVSFHGYRHLHISNDDNLPTPVSIDDLSLKNNSKSIWLPSVSMALEFITNNWKQNFVISNLEKANQFDGLLARPFCLILAIQEPSLKRFERLKLEDPSLTLDIFLQNDDRALYDDLLIDVFPKARLTIANAGNSMDKLRNVIRTLKLDERWTRPHWDAYFMEMAELASKRSNCMKRGVGCLIVKDKRVVATGYNGTASGVLNCCDGGCARCNGNTKCGIALETCLCLHAEDNALLEAGRGRCTDSTLYCTTAPCLNCSVKLVQCGIKRIVYAKEYSIAQDATKLFKEASVELVKFTHELAHFIDVDYN